MRLNGWIWKGEPGEGYSRLYLAVTPRCVRRWGGYGLYVKGIPGRVRSFGWRAFHRGVNLARDAEAFALGFCNHKPWPAQGGYAHWRCARTRLACRSMSNHRSNNYIWARRGKARVQYAPIDLRAPSDAVVIAKSRPYRERYGTPTLLQARRWKAEIARAREERREREILQP
jgi:hypothetical protein